MTDIDASLMTSGDRETSRDVADPSGSSLNISKVAVLNSVAKGKTIVQKKGVDMKKLFG
jgi:hypothetical protein